MVQPHIRDVVRGKNRYCGPAAISIISGIDTTRTAKLLRMVSGKTMVCGIVMCHMRSALFKLGYELKVVGFSGKTLAQWMDSDRSQTAMFLVISGCHYSIVQGNQYCCGQTLKVVDKSKAAHRRSHMESVYEVVKSFEIDPQTVVPIPVVDKSWLKRIVVTKKAKAHGVEIDDQSRQGGAIWVYPPDGLFDPEGDDPRDPYNDAHFHDTWEEVEKAVDDYIVLKDQPPVKVAACPSSPNPSS